MDAECFGRSGVLALGISLLAACDGSSPTGPQGPPTAPVLTSSLWAGTVGFEAAGPAGSCEATWLAKHPEAVGRSASASLGLSATGATLDLATSDGQACLFSGSLLGGTLQLATQHENCVGSPLTGDALGGIVDVCHSIDPRGDGPYWGNGTFTGSISDRSIFGTWRYQAYDPGSTRFTVELRIDLTKR